MLDGEIVIAGPGGLEFDALSQRIHPAEKRIRQLAESTPASFVAFDLLAEGDRSLMEAPYAERRAALEKALKKARPPVHLTPVTDDPDVAADWFSRFEGAGLDGVVVKDGALTYMPDKRAMVKVKHQRTADCVVAGFRTHKDGAGVGSLLLGLFDPSGTLHHVGVASGFSVARRRELVAELEPYRKNAQKDHPWAGWAEAQAAGRAPGGTNRWNAGKDMTWEPVAARSGVRGLLRPPAAGPLPARHVLRALAPGPRPGVVHVRAARHAGADGVERGLRDVVRVVSRADRDRPPARRALPPPRSR